MLNTNTNINPNGLSEHTQSASSSISVHPEIFSLAPFEQRLQLALADLRDGRPVLLMDDFDRENEADLIVAAEKISIESMARMIRDGSGIVCLCLPDEKLQQLELPPMVSHNESRYGTAFTVSIEAKQGVTTGVSAADRVTTVLTAIAADAKPEHLARPGHVFPLRAVAGGVLQRRGHTEGSVDLATMAGLAPAAVLCELMNPDGSMTHGAQVQTYALTHDLVILTIDELAQYRSQHP
ncbi:3,4-dihydroxy-2-butanone-4-phosphate synthase [Undibacterium sp. Dicai25W]|uniref:3,4-dihydroxy-2-butanone-4-phosphate synthase n=1 Tax=Undibacterium sp. Dicai25W TaxID=3413034 RepID=UPI003BF29C8E